MMWMKIKMKMLQLEGHLKLYCIQLGKKIVLLSFKMMKELKSLLWSSLNQI